MIGSCSVTCSVATKTLLWVEFLVPGKLAAEVVGEDHNWAVWKMHRQSCIR